MIEKKTADVVNFIFEKQIWRFKNLVCGVCKASFRYTPLIYTYSDSLQTVCCGSICCEAIRLRQIDEEKRKR